jgi:hypothetical protein
MNNKYEYECALSGLVASGEIPFEKDGLEDMPHGWIEVKMSRRMFNPKWVLIQQVKRAMLDGLMSQFAEDVQEAQGVAIQLQVDAQFYGMEQDTPPYVTEVETVYLAPPEMSEDVAESVNECRELLGLEPLEEEEDEEEAEAEAEAEAEEEAAAEVEPETKKKKKKAAKA